MYFDDLRVGMQVQTAPAVQKLQSTHTIRAENWC